MALTSPQSDKDTQQTHQGQRQALRCGNNDGGNQKKMEEK